MGLQLCVYIYMLFHQKSHFQWLDWYINIHVCYNGNKKVWLWDNMFVVMVGYNEFEHHFGNIVDSGN